MVQSVTGANATPPRCEALSHLIKKAAHKSRFFVGTNGILSYLSTQFFVERIDDNRMRLIDLVVRKRMALFEIMRHRIAIFERQADALESR